MFTMPEGPVYSPSVKAAAVAALGPNGAWLLLSIDHYLRRARYDLAKALIEGRPDLDSHLGRHVQSMIDLEIQSSVFAATEQLLRLVFACLSHQPGTERFFSTYVQWATVAPLINRAQQVTREELDQLVGVPKDTQQMIEILEHHGVDADPVLAEAALQRINALFDEIHTNLTEFAQLTDPPQGLENAGMPIPGAGPDGQPPEPRPLRHLDNSYRHGLKVLIPDTLPEERAFHAMGPDDVEIVEGPYFVNLYMGNDEPVLGGVDARPQRTEQNLEALARVCLRIKQLARAFLGTRILNEPGTVLTLHHLDLEPVGQDLV